MIKPIFFSQNASGTAGGKGGKTPSTHSEEKADKAAERQSGNTEIVQTGTTANIVRDRKPWVRR